MASYRFCRPDDIPYLVRAVNECFNVHFPDQPPMTVERFRAEMKVLDVWPSNSMVAATDAGPIAVLIGTKRPQEVLVSRIGVRPGHGRQGQGRHLLTSLSQKLAVLGPERLVAEVPRALAGAGELFRAAGYRREATFVDWVRPRSTVEPVPEELFLPTTFRELADQGVLGPEAEAPWERTYETLAHREDLRGVAIASPERLEAFLLYRIPGGDAAADVVAAGGRESGERELYLSLLLRHLAGRTTGRLRLPKLADDELPRSLLAAFGFEPAAEYDRYTARATPA